LDLEIKKLKTLIFVESAFFSAMVIIRIGSTYFETAYHWSQFGYA